MRFEKVNPEKCFYFIGFEITNIEKQEFLKINVLDKISNTAFSIYKKNDNGDIYDYISELEDFECIDDKVYVVYKNGRLKFDMRTQA